MNTEELCKDRKETEFTNNYTKDPFHKSITARYSTNRLKQDAERYRKLTKYLLSTRTDMDDAIVACDTQKDLDAVIDQL